MNLVSVQQSNHINQQNKNIDNKIVTVNEKLSNNTIKDIFHNIKNDNYSYEHGKLYKNLGNFERDHNEFQDQKDEGHSIGSNNLNSLSLSPFSRVSNRLLKESQINKLNKNNHNHNNSIIQIKEIKDYPGSDNFDYLHKFLNKDIKVSKNYKDNNIKSKDKNIEYNLPNEIQNISQFNKQPYLKKIIQTKAKTDKNIKQYSVSVDNSSRKTREKNQYSKLQLQNTHNQMINQQENVMNKSSEIIVSSDYSPKIVSNIFFQSIQLITNFSIPNFNNCKIPLMTDDNFTHKANKITQIVKPDKINIYNDNNIADTDNYEVTYNPFRKNYRRVSENNLLFFGKTKSKKLILSEKSNTTNTTHTTLTPHTTNYTNITKATNITNLLSTRENFSFTISKNEDNNEVNEFINKNFLIKRKNNKYNNAYSSILLI